MINKTNFNGRHFKTVKLKFMKFGEKLQTNYTKRSVGFDVSVSICSGVIFFFEKTKKQNKTQNSGQTEN